ncbi:MAG: glycosyltransferase [Bacteroidales bacterium]|nr:glycosyltransferase [Bacteroidales bacterium]
MKKVTILIPCYNEEASLPALHDALISLMDSQPNYTWEILFVNDGSRDGTLDILRELHTTDHRFCFVSLSRNFGKECAMLSGFDHAKGDCLVIMDADLQHPPMLISEMLRYWEDGYEDIYAKRKVRGKESLWKKKTARLYYRLLQHTTRLDILPDVGDFRLLDRKCIDVMKNLRESERNTKALFAWIGFKKKEILFEPQDRVAGETKWNLSNLINLAIDGITSFTTLPLRLATIIGLFVSTGAFIYIIAILIKTIFLGESVKGFPTLMVTILFLGGIQFLALGIIGEYLGKIFNESKNRPIYVVSEYEGE